MSEAEEKTIAIIGAGISGLITAKEALGLGMVPTVFEKAEKVGGLWRRGLWKNFRTDMVKFNTAFSCKRWAKAVDIFPHRDQVIGYIEEFVEENGLDPYIRFETAVEKCEKTEENQWTVTVTHQGQKSANTYDFLVIANGLNNIPKMPTIPGLDTFPGPTMHSLYYNAVEHLQEGFKKVLIVGGNFSGTEIATDIVSHSTAEVNMIVCSGHKKFDSVSSLAANAFISPMDMLRYAAYNQYVNESEKSAERQDFHRVMGNVVFTHEQGNEFMTIKKGKEGAYKTVNKLYLENLGKGRIKVFKSPIQRVEGRTVVLANEDTIEADIIIFATGFYTDFPFICDADKKLLGYAPADQGTPLLLYYDVYNPNLPNLGFVGYIKGLFFPMIELQAKFITSVFAGKSELPPIKVMRNFIDKKNELRILRAKLPVLPVETLHEAVDFAVVAQASPLTEELRKSYPRVYETFVSKPFNACIFNFVGRQAHPVQAFSTYVEMLRTYNDRLTPDEHREFVNWIASLDRNFDTLTNLFTGSFVFERVVQDFRNRSNLVMKGTATFAAEEDHRRVYRESASEVTDCDPYFANFGISVDPKVSGLRFQMADLSFFLNFKKNPLFCSDQVDTEHVFAALDLHINSLGKFTLSLLVKTDAVDQRISTKYRLKEADR